MNSPTGVDAVYGTDSGGERRVPVIMFDQGRAMVLMPRTDVLAPASEAYSGFTGLETSSSVTVVPALPGWQAWGDPDGADPWVEPVLAWAIYRNSTNTGVPLVPDREAGILIDLDNARPYRLVGPVQAGPADA